MTFVVNRYPEGTEGLIEQQAPTQRMTLKVNSDIEAQVEFWRSDARVRAYIGGVGSGKTFAGVVEILRQPRGTVGLVVAPTYPMLRDSTQRTFFELCPPALIKEHNKSENRTELTNGSTILWRTGEGSGDRLRGPNISWAYCDEGCYLSLDVFKVILGRLRRRPGRCWLTSTPKGQNWVYDRWVRSPVEGYKLFTGKTAYNPYLPEGFVDDLRAEFGSGAYAAQELEGQFVDLSGDKRLEGQLLASVFEDVPTLLRGIPDSVEVNGRSISAPGSMVRLYDAPEPARQYVIGVDPAEGLATGDDSALVVAERMTGRVVCVVAGSLEPAEVLPGVVALVSRHYNRAPVLIERNNHGHAVIAGARRLGVVCLQGADSRAGYNTTNASKAQMYDAAQRALMSARADKLKVLPDLRLKEQLASIDRLTLRAPGKGRLNRVDDEAVAFCLAMVARQGATVAQARSRVAMRNMFRGR